MVKNQELLAGVSADAIDAPFYTNHDMARSAGYYTGKNAEDKLKLAQALNFLMPGNAFIYYGEELGMKGSGKDENKRAPMYWTAGSDSVMCKGPKDMDSFKMKYPALDEQAKDPYSIYNYCKAAIKLRNLYPVIARGKTKALEELSDKNVCAFLRYTDEATDGFGPLELMILVNTSGEEKTIDISAATDMQNLHLTYQLNTSEALSQLDGGSLNLAPYGVVVLDSEN